MEGGDAATVTYTSSDLGSTEGYSSGSSRELDPIIPCAIAISVVGLLANGWVLVVVIFFTKMRKRLSGILIFNQTLIDFCSCLVQIAQSLTEVYTDTRQVPVTGLAGELYCRIYMGKVVLYGVVTASTINIGALTIERYLCVAHPIFYKTRCTADRARPILVSIWFLGIFLHAVTNIPTTVIVGNKCYPAAKFYTSQELAFAHGFYIASVYLFIPVLVMMFCYGRMVWVLRMGKVLLQTNGAQPQSLAKNKLSHTQANLLMTMAIVCACFVICWSGSIIVWILYLAEVVGPAQYTEAMFYPTILRLANMCVNPFIYILQYEEFKNGMRKMKRRVQPGPVSASATNQSTGE